MRISKYTKEVIEAAIAEKRKETGIDNATADYEAAKAKVLEEVRAVYDEANEKITAILEENDFVPSQIMGKNLLNLCTYKLDSSKRNEVCQMAATVAETYFKKKYNDITDELKLYGNAADLGEILEAFKNEPVDFIADAKRIIEEKEIKLAAKREAEESRRSQIAKDEAERITAMIEEEFKTDMAVVEELVSDLQ